MIYNWLLLSYARGYLKAPNIDLPRIIGVTDFKVLQTWVAASYATHSDLRSHTGGVISLGHGVIPTKSSKQKINTKSSTEAELVGASNFIKQ